MSVPFSEMAYVDITYMKYDSGAGGYMCQRVYDPDGKEAGLNQVNYVYVSSTSHVMQVQTARVKMEGTRFTFSLPSRYFNVNLEKKEINSVGLNEGMILVYRVDGMVKSVSDGS